MVLWPFEIKASPSRLPGQGTIHQFGVVFRRNDRRGYRSGVASRRSHGASETPPLSGGKSPWHGNVGRPTLPLNGGCLAKVFNTVVRKGGNRSFLASLRWFWFNAVLESHLVIGTRQRRPLVRVCDARWCPSESIGASGTVKSDNRFASHGRLVIGLASRPRGLPRNDSSELAGTLGPTRNEQQRADDPRCKPCAEGGRNWLAIGQPPTSDFIGPNGTTTSSVCAAAHSGSTASGRPP